MRCMIGIDTNILINAFDLSQPEKRAISREIILDMERNPWKYAISTQVIAEFVNVAKKKINRSEKAIRFIFHLSSILRVVEYSVVDIELASRAKRFWDSLMALTYMRSGCTTIITENTRHMPKIESLEFVNPYRKR